MSASLPGVVAFVHRLHTIASIHVTLFLIVNDNNVSQCMYYNKPVLYIYNSWDEAMFQVVMTFNNVIKTECLHPQPVLLLSSQLHFLIILVAMIIPEPLLLYLL